MSIIFYWSTDDFYTKSIQNIKIKLFGVVLITRNVYINTYDYTITNTESGNF